MPVNVISTENMTYTYNSVKAISAISLSFKMTIFAAVGFSVLSVINGIIVSFMLNLPAGGTIVIFNAAFLLIIFGAKKILRFQR